MDSGSAMSAGGSLALLAWLAAPALTAWSEPAEYLIGNDPLDADRFKQHYERLKHMKVATLPGPQALLLSDLCVYFELDSAQIRPHIFNQPQRSFAESDHTQASVLTAAGLGFHIVPFPGTLTEKPPQDKDWVIGLFAPSGSMLWEFGGILLPSPYYIAGYGFSDSVQENTNEATDAPALQLSPLVTFCDYGGPSEEIELMPAGAQATWGAEGTLLGELLQQDGKHYYKPPQSVTPLVRFNEGGDTFIPAAYRDTLATPTATDIIKVSEGGQDAHATFVIRKVQATHFIRVAKQAGGLKLSLCYFNIDLEEIAVPDSQASWQVVVGNGSVVSGVFKPAVNNPSPFTVVMGVDTSRQDEWRWGLTIIAMPLLDIDTLVDYYSR